MKKGSHLVSKRTLYTHHGIYIGDDKVIHYSGFSDGLKNEGEVEVVSLGIFSSGNSYKIRKHPNKKYNSKESIQRANSRLGEEDYSLFNNNCEHFVNWCIDGEHESNQVNNAVNTTRATTVATMGTNYYLKNKIPEVIAKELILKEAIKRTATSSLIKSSASTVTGSVAGITAVSATTGVTATTFVSAIAAGSFATVAAPIAIGITVGVSVTYGAKKLFDWLTD